MDAQNAAESTTTPRPTAPDRRPEQTRKTVLNLPSSPPIKQPVIDGANEDDANSDAETVVLPGKDGYSPSKTRKVINKADRKVPDERVGLTNSGSIGEHHTHWRDRDWDRERDREHNRERHHGRDVERVPSLRPGMGGLSAEAASSLVAKKKQPLQDNQRASLKDTNSSGLSSAPCSPPPQQNRGRLSEHRSQPESDTESPRARSPKLALNRERQRAVDKIVPHKRKTSSRAQSDDDGESVKKIRRQRPPGPSLDTSSAALGKNSRDPKVLSRQYPSDSHANASHVRSASPQRKPQHQSLSAQLSSSTGLGQKKKRVPPPLSTDYHSDDSSASGSPHPRNHKLKSLATPAAADSIISPAKMAPHKKHLDAHGQTLLARACARGEHDIAKARLMERPDDLNVADYAGNTPLQIASLNGHEEIVKLLVDSGCALDCVNNDRDTPLLDAVDNGHLVVIRLLLDAGVNPRKTNLNGEEPLDRVSDQLDNADEIRTAIREARNRPSASWRRASEEHHGHDQSPQDSHPSDRYSRDARSHGPESPRRSPAALASTAPGRRAATSRSNKTSNSQLYKPLDDKTLRQAACRGDEETVLRILQVKEGFNDPESMVGAARGGHETVMQYLLALGGCDPDPKPVTHLASDASTPMLAAIGQGTLGIVKLLLSQTNFDPTRKWKGETYYDIARRRQGPEWEEEEGILKDAYNEHRKKQRGSNKDKSPNRRALVKDRPARPEAKDDGTRAHKRKLSSPSREVTKSKSQKVKTSSPKEQKTANSFPAPEDQRTAKKGPGRPRKEVPNIPISNRDESPHTTTHKAVTTKVKRQDLDHGAVSSEGEAAAAKPRRKLVSGRELKDERERERQRRSSMVSNNSNKDGSSPKEKDDSSDKFRADIPSEKYHDRAKAIRRDDSKDRLGISGDSTSKRPRSSVTPPRQGAGDRDENEVTFKRRRMDSDSKEKPRRSSNTSTEDRHRKQLPLRDAGITQIKPSVAKDADKEARREALKVRKLTAKANSTAEKSGKIKSEDVDMNDAPPVKTEDGMDPKAKWDEEKERRAKARTAEARKREDEQRKLAEEKKEKEEERKRREVAEARRQEEAKRQEEARKQEQARLLEEVRRREEEERKTQEEEERKQREELHRKLREEEQRAKEAEKRRLREEEEKRLRLEEMRLREEEEQRRQLEAQLRREEELRKRQEEEERLRKERLEWEAAARRKEAEERERLAREEMERLRIAEEAEQRRIREREARLSKLPLALRWLDGCSNPRTSKLASKFTQMYGVRYDTIVADAVGSPETLRELWMLNTDVALVLGDKDLNLSSYASWVRIPASELAKKEWFHVENGKYSLISRPLWELAQQLPTYAMTLGGSRGLKVAQDRQETYHLFTAMDLFFVRVCHSNHSQHLLLFYFLLLFPSFYIFYIIHYYYY